MPSKHELYAAIAFFVLAAAAVAAFRRPFDVAGWACLAICIAFVVLGCAALLKPDFSAGRRTLRPAAAIGVLDEDGVDDEDDEDEPIGDPPAEELRVFGDTVAALEAVGAIAPAEVDARDLWRAAQRFDPGQRIGVNEALGAFAVLHEYGRARIGRLTFVPSHSEYDAALVAEIVASALTSLGHDLVPADIGVELPQGGGEGAATVSFSIAGRPERVACHYRWKYPPDDLLETLRRFRKDDDPRDLVGADPGDQTLLYAAVRSGSLAELNGRLPAQRELFFEA